MFDREGTPRFTGTHISHFHIPSPGRSSQNVRGCLGVWNNGKNQTTRFPSLNKTIQYVLLLSNQSLFLCSCPPNIQIEHQLHFPKHLSFLHLSSIIRTAIQTYWPPKRPPQSPAALSRRHNTLRLRDLVSKRGPWRLQTLRQPRQRSCRGMSETTEESLYGKSCMCCSE